MQISWNQDEYIRAYLFAAEAHMGKEIEGKPGIPYIIHPSLVSMAVVAAMQADQGLDRDLATQCSLLHDVIEDTPITFENVKAQFGERVAKGVGAVTKDPELDKTLQMADCLRRIKEQPREVWMVKLADRIDLPPKKESSCDVRLESEKWG